jgi:hypothetical protein
MWELPISPSLAMAKRWKILAIPPTPLNKRAKGGFGGQKMDLMPLQVREWTCPQCGTVHDRDINAAQNLLAVGHTVTACGASVRLEGYYSGKE